MIDAAVFGRPLMDPDDLPGFDRRRADLYIALSEPAQQTVATVPDGFPWLAVTPGREHQVRFSAWRRGAGANGRLHPQAAMELGLGTGKTLMGLEEILKLQAAQKGRVAALYLAPNSVLRTVWDVQLPKHAPTLRYVILDGPMKKRREFLAHRLHTVDVVIHSTESYPMMADALNAIPWDFAGIDEHQDFRNWLSERSKALLGRGRYRRVGPLGARIKIIGSGTPTIKRATDVYAPYKWLVNCFGTIAQFRTDFVRMGGFGGHEEVGLKPGAEVRLRSILDHHRYVVPKSILGFPDPVFHWRRVTLPPWQRQLYQKVQRDLRTEVDGVEAVIINKLTEFLRLAQVTDGFEAIDKDVYHWQDGNAKATYLFDTVLPEVFQEEERAIIWAWFRPTIAELTRMARAKGYRPVAFTGGDNNAKAAAQQAFNAGDANLFIGQMKAGGRGLNLGENRTMIYYGRSFDTEAYIQSLGRDERQDSSNRLVRNRIILEADDTIDQYITAVLKGDVALASLLSSVRVKEILGIA